MDVNQNSLSTPEQTNEQTATPGAHRYLIAAFAVLGAVCALAAAFAIGKSTGRTESFPWSRATGISAVSSCESCGAVISTGYFNNNAEALYYLDSQSGRLSAALLSRSDPEFVKTYTRNIKGDFVEALGSYPNVPVPPRPNFIMVTGDSDIRNVGAGEMNNLAKSFVYVAEVQTGIVLVYILPLEGDRDLAVEKGEIEFWTFARLNTGTGIMVPANSTNPPAAAPAAPAPAASAGTPAPASGIGAR